MVNLHNFNIRYRSRVASNIPPLFISSVILRNYY